VLGEAVVLGGERGGHLGLLIGNRGFFRAFGFSRLEGDEYRRMAEKGNCQRNRLRSLD
jgi:hypothetical protein